MHPATDILAYVIEVMNGKVVKISLPAETFIISPNAEHGSVRDPNQYDVAVAVTEVIRVLRADF